jgi:hypothetical protein
MHAKAVAAGACRPALKWLDSLPPDSDPLRVEHPDRLEWAYWYARNVIQGRWPEAEPVIMGNPDAAYQYAQDVIQGRWPEAEPVIMGNPDAAYWYARDVIQGRWPEAEPVIMSNPDAAYQYT